MKQVTLSTNIKENYLSDFETFSGLYGNNFNQLRKSAIQAFERTGLPLPKSEEWKYLNLLPVFSHPFVIANPSSKPGITKEEIAKYKVAGKDAMVLVFVNGIFNEALSDHAVLENGVKVSCLQKSDMVENFGRSVNLNDNPFDALNTAFFSDVAYVNIPPNIEFTQPVHILHINDSQVESTSSFPRNLIVAGKNSKVQIIVTYHSINANNQSLSNSITEVFVDENAYVELDMKQNENNNAYHFNQIYVTQKRNSTFDIFTVTLGGALVRNNLTIRLTETNCNAHLFGLTLAGGTQVIDNHTVVDHASPNCYSNQLYKSILDGKSQGVFNGKIFVRKDAQKTNAYQSNKNVLLSNEAVMNTKPQLEIFADDVKCSHGATIGQLDEDALFYFQSRGIGEIDARALLNFAFASDVIQKINNDSLKVNLLKLLAKKLHSQIEFDLM